MHHFIARLKCHDIYLVENLALGLTSQISKAMYVSTGKPIYMEKLTRIMFRATFLIFIFTALSASVAAIDIKTVFLNLNHPRLKESLSPQPGTASSYGELSQILGYVELLDAVATPRVLDRGVSWAGARYRWVVAVSTLPAPATENVTETIPYP